MSLESKRRSKDFERWLGDKDLKPYIEAAKIGDDPKLQQAFIDLVTKTLSPPQYSSRRKILREARLDADTITDLASNLKWALISRAPLRGGTDPQVFEGPACHRKSLGYVQSQRE